MNLGFGPRTKSPILARCFSMVPGLGHIYAGAYTSGIIWLFFALVLFSSVYFGYIDLFAVGSGRTLVIGYYLIMVVWCWKRAGQIVIEKNQQLANQDYFEQQKIVEEQDKLEAIQAARLNEEKLKAECQKMQEKAKNG